jgi:hypothetical protein
MRLLAPWCALEVGTADLTSSPDPPEAQQDQDWPLLKVKALWQQGGGFP